MNFGFVLVVWDRLARRAEFPVDGPPIVTGIAKRPVPMSRVSPVPFACRRPGSIGPAVPSQLGDGRVYPDRGWAVTPGQFTAN